MIVYIILYLYVLYLLQNLFQFELSNLNSVLQINYDKLCQFCIRISFIFHSNIRNNVIKCIAKLFMGENQQYSNKLFLTELMGFPLRTSDSFEILHVGCGHG